MVKKYIAIYMKRNIFLALFCALIVFVPIFITALVFKPSFYDAVIGSTLPFLLAAVCVAVSSIPTVRFRKMISEQETEFGEEFSDNGVEHLETTLFLSDSWLIWAGSCALRKEKIKSVGYKTEYGRAGSSNRVTIKTTDGRKYKIWCLSSTSIKRIRQWKKQ